jgi:glycerol transport system ATP-binding protein
MAEVLLRDLAHSYQRNPSKPEDYAVRPLEMIWQDGGAYALLGPSGCGKTTLLNIISGLIKPTQGKVLFDGKDVTELPAEKRNIAQVFQFPVIYDTMTVFDNLAFPLRNRGVQADEVRRRVQEIAELLELTSDLKRRASGLSADVKQKISLGRGLVRSDVAAILFDEPLTVIDPHLKLVLRSKLKQIHRQFNLTLIYVTHDQTEALTFADQVVVMYEGSVVQIGTPQELFESPAHTFVGYFIGSPGMNLLPARLVDGRVYTGDATLPIDPGSLRLAADDELAVGIRPEFVTYSTVATPDALPAQIVRIEDLGNYQIVTAEVGQQIVKAKVDEDTYLENGKAWLRFPAERLRLYVNGKAL